MSSYFISNANKDTCNVKRILLVDDDPSCSIKNDVISLLKMVIEMNGFEVDGYTDTLGALSNFKVNSYGLALLDIRMSPMNGFELYRKLREMDSNIEAGFISAFKDYRQ